MNENKYFWIAEIERISKYWHRNSLVDLHNFSASDLKEFYETLLEEVKEFPFEKVRLKKETIFLTLN